MMLMIKKSDDVMNRELHVCVSIFDFQFERGILWNVLVCDRNSEGEGTTEKRFGGKQTPAD